MPKITPVSAPENLDSLRRDAYSLMSPHIRRGKFWQQDLDNLWERICEKTEQQLIETIQRQTAIDNVSDREIILHCQTEDIL